MSILPFMVVMVVGEVWVVSESAKIVMCCNIRVHTHGDDKFQSIHTVCPFAPNTYFVRTVSTKMGGCRCVCEYACDKM
ncbi:hypothetical protein L210DRAFT_3549367 [Boletus edulis BED1]|uniref:Secreted protein n=1 Tax=Boletus edulis BED1 TaxID=1328754 RepID=A0AAD4GC38_BOLED|nr:hypothetical protein L210DRAFT_3549367 [Boletus edulis BED1]